MNITEFKLERYFAQHEFNVDYVLCCSDCESVSIAELLDLEENARDQFERLQLGYTESQGSPALRNEISKIYNYITPDQVLVHTGAEEAIFLFMHAVLKKSDHVIVHWPCYQSLIEVAGSIGCKVTKWKGNEQNGWKLDTNELKDYIQPNTKVIVINSPHNPTGYHMSPQIFEEVNQIAKKNGIILFSDEVYRESEYDIKDRLPAACDFGNHAVSLGVMSKTYGLAGLRIGWIATQHADIYSQMALLKDYTTICNSAPSEFLAEMALRHREKLINRNVGIITKNLTVLDEFFDRQKDVFNWQRPVAGPIAFPRLIELDIDNFCDQLMQHYSVLLLPGSVYDDKENHFRIGFGRKNMPEAVNRLNDFMQQF